MEEMVSIEKSYYDSLERSALKLDALKASGVDNWLGWADAMELFNEWLKEEE